MNPPPQPAAGFSLIELMVAGLMASLLMVGAVQLASAGAHSLRMVESVSDVQQGGRLGVDRLRETIMSAGFHPHPWQQGAEAGGLSLESSDGGAGGSDTLVVRQWSDRNCFDNFNPNVDGHGRPRFFLKVSKFERTARNDLAQTCHYGAADGLLVRQINREGLIQRVESFQLLYAEDTDGDRRANRHVRAGRWASPENVLGIEVGLMVATDKNVRNESTAPMVVLDEVVTPPADGRLRRVWLTTIAIGSRLR